MFQHSTWPRGKRTKGKQIGMKVKLVRMVGHKDLGTEYTKIRQHSSPWPIILFLVLTKQVIIFRFWRETPFPKENIYKEMLRASVNMPTFKPVVEIITCLFIFINLVTHAYSRLDAFKYCI